MQLFAEYACSTCGKKDSWERFGETDSIEVKLMKEKEVCFTCACWLNRIEEGKTDDRFFVVNGISYWFGNRIPEDQPASFKDTHGFSGRKVHILRNGEHIYTDNLWDQGRIPDQFRDQLPDTAEF